MADLRGLFANNRRREAQAAVGTIPYAIADADLREGTAAVVATNEAYTLLTLPDNILVTNVDMIIETGSEFVAGTVSLFIGSTEIISVVSATSLTTAGVIDSFTTPTLIEGSADVVATCASLTVDAGNANAAVKFVISYVDYDRATMSYIGEE